MRKQLLFFAILLVATTASAIDVGGIVKQASGGGSSAINLDKVFDDVKKSAREEIQKGVAGLKTELQGTINKEVDKLTKQLDEGVLGRSKRLVERAEKEFDGIIAIKNNIGNYLSIAKLVGISVGAVIVVLILVLILSYMRASRLMGVIGSINEINKRLDRIEQLLRK